MDVVDRVDVVDQACGNGWDPVRSGLKAARQGKTGLAGECDSKMAGAITLARASRNAAKRALRRAAVLGRGRRENAL
jgi:hypothetical protein